MESPDFRGRCPARTRDEMDENHDRIDPRTVDSLYTKIGP